jgi:hypothetical protein
VTAQFLAMHFLQCKAQSWRVQERHQERVACFLKILLASSDGNVSQLKKGGYNKGQRGHWWSYTQVPHLVYLTRNLIAVTESRKPIWASWISCWPTTVCLTFIRILLFSREVPCSPSVFEFRYSHFFYLPTFATFPPVESVLMPLRERDKVLSFKPYKWWVFVVRLLLLKQVVTLWKVKLLCLLYKGVWESRGVAPLTVNAAVGGVFFTLRPLYAQGTNPGPLNRRLHRPREPVWKF